MPDPIHLPGWAQHTNPLVHRNLTPTALSERVDRARIMRVLLVSGALIAGSLALNLLESAALGGAFVTLLFSPVLVVVYAFIMGAFFGLPVLFVLYGRLLARVSTDAAGMLLREREEDRLALLRTIPRSLRSILLSQVAASIWNQSMHLDTLLWLAGLLTLPPIVVTHATLWFAEAPPVLLRLTMLAGLVTAFARPWLELVMAGALGTLAGAFARYRLSAGISASLLLGAYFILVNLPRLLPLGMFPRLLVEVVLPLALPPLITLLALTVAERSVTAQ